MYTTPKTAWILIYSEIKVVSYMSELPYDHNDIKIYFVIVSGDDQYPVYILYYYPIVNIVLLVSDYVTSNTVSLTANIPRKNITR
jgi:hypothetical protein